MKNNKSFDGLGQVLYACPRFFYEGRTYMDIKGTILRAKDGHPVPVLEREGLKRHLGSMYDGAVAASCWCEKVASKRTENIILFGMGDCRIVLELIEKVPGQILIYEPESFVFSQMRTSNLYKKAVKCRRVKIFQASECAKFSCVAKDLLDDDWVEETMLAVHPGYVDWYEEEFLKVQEICQKICDDITFMRAPLKRFTVAMIRNQIANFPNMTKGVPLKRLYRRENADIPIILVSAGPSLEKNVEDLKEAKGHALIWCADAALPTMLSHQVIPDLVASVDAGKDLACFADERSNQIPVLGSSNTRTEFLKRNTAKKIWGFDHEQSLMMQKRAGIEISQVPYYLGVSTAMLSSAIEFGAENIIFVGQDLAYASDGSSHTNGKKEYYVDASGIETDGYYGDKVYSRMDWLEFKDWFEKMIALYPSITVTNATEGGVRIDGTIQKPLKEVCQELGQKAVCFEDFLEAEDNQITEKEAVLMKEQMVQCVRDLEAVRLWGYDVTFFEKDYHQFPVMSMILSYMKILEGDRRERFETALSFVSDELEKGGWGR